MISQQVTTRHLQRQAYLCVRQSTLLQVLENTESTVRQYALRERALDLGWKTEQVVVIDQDLGHSGASSVDRACFQRLVADVGLGRQFTTYSPNSKSCLCGFTHIGNWIAVANQDRNVFRGWIHTSEVKINSGDQMLSVLPIH